MRRLAPFILLLGLLSLAGCATTGGRLGAHGAPAEIGLASFYAHRFDGHRTAGGEIYDENALTAAHPTLPFGTRVRVTNLSNDRCVVVRINDRGPQARGRIIDLSRRAARELGCLREGVARVSVEVVGR
jgi:rare lipoprotein A